MAFLAVTNASCRAIHSETACDNRAVGSRRMQWPRGTLQLRLSRNSGVNEQVTKER